MESSVPLLGKRGRLKTIGSNRYVWVAFLVATGAMVSIMLVILVAVAYAVRDSLNGPTFVLTGTFPPEESRRSLGSIDYVYIANPTYPESPCEPKLIPVLNATTFSVELEKHVPWMIALIDSSLEGTGMVKHTLALHNDTLNVVYGKASVKVRLGELEFDNPGGVRPKEGIGSRIGLTKKQFAQIASMDFMNYHFNPDVDFGGQIDFAQYRKGLLPPAMSMRLRFRFALDVTENDTLTGVEYVGMGAELYVDKVHESQLTQQWAFQSSTTALVQYDAENELTRVVDHGDAVSYSVDFAEGEIAQGDYVYHSSLHPSPFVFPGVQVNLTKICSTLFIPLVAGDGASYEWVRYDTTAQEQTPAERDQVELTVGHNAVRVKCSDSTFNFRPIDYGFEASGEMKTVCDAGIMFISYTSINGMSFEYIYP